MISDPLGSYNPIERDSAIRARRGRIISRSRGIHEEFGKRGIEFAYPTQTLYVSKT